MPDTYSSDEFPEKQNARWAVLRQASACHRHPCQGASIHLLNAVLQYTQIGSRILVLHLHPALRPARPVSRIKALGHDAFKPETAGVIENNWTIGGKVFAAWTFGHQRDLVLGVKLGRHNGGGNPQ